MARVGVSPSRCLKLFDREIIFEVLQPVWKTYLNVTDGQTDGGTTYCGITALWVAVVACDDAIAKRTDNIKPEKERVSEQIEFYVPLGRFRDESFQAITCTGSANKKAVLSQGNPHDAVENFDVYSLALDISAR